MSVPTHTARVSAVSIVRLEGVVASLSGATESQPTAPVVFIDLAAVTRVTSLGARELAGLFGRLAEGGRQVVLADCPPPVVALLNLIRGFAGDAVVLSVKAPYFCDRCGREKSLTLPAEALAASDEPEAPPLLCEDDGAPLVFDDIERSYFAFARRVRHATASPELFAALAAAREGRVPEEVPAAPPHDDSVVRAAIRDESRAAQLLLPAADRAFWVVVGALLGVLALVGWNAL